MNRINLVGRLVREPEVNTTNGGIKYLKGTVAVNDRFVKDGVDFIPFTAWRQNADFLGKYAHKGDLISVEGSLKQNIFETKDGVRVTNYNVVTDNTSILSSKKKRPVEKTASTFQPKVIVDKTGEGSVPWEMDI